MDDSSGTGTGTGIRELSTTAHRNMTIDACGKEIETLLKADFLQQVGCFKCIDYVV